MRLGEILFKLGLISAEELERALRAQVVHSGRIGTNLVEMGFVGLDEVAHGLSQQHRVSAALQSHFDQVDQAIVKLVPGHLAVKHAAIPLGMPRGSSRELAVALVDPLDIDATDEIAFAVGMRIRPAVAPELRITYYLERFYGFQRDHRHRRAPSAGGHVTTIPGLGVERRRYIELNPEPEHGPPPQVATAMQTQREAERCAREAEQRRLLGNKQTLRQYRDESPTDEPRADEPRADEPPTAEPARAPVVVLPASRGASPGSDGKSTLAGRARAPRRAPTPPPVARAEPARGPLSLAEATDAIAHAGHRDAIGDALIDYVRAHAGCGLVLICREGLALGWKGFGPEVDEAMIESIAFPLMVPSMLRQAFDDKQIYQGSPPGDGATIQRRLWKLLRCGEPDQIVVAPVMLKDRVVNLVYCHPPQGGSLALTVAGEIATLCAAASTAFLRIITSAKHEM